MKNVNVLSAISALALLVGAPAPALAQDLAQSAATAQRGLAPGWWLYASLAGGYAGVDGGEFSVHPNGSQFQFSGLASHLSRSWVVDLGVGYSTSSVNGAVPGTSNVKISHRTGFGEVSARYRLDANWQLGPVVESHFGAESSFAAVDTGKTFSTLIGGKLAYQIPMDNWAMRAFVKVVTDLDIENRQATVASIGLQIGLPVSPSPVVVASSESSSSSQEESYESTEITTTTRDTVVTTVSAPVRESIPITRLHFNTASTQVSNSSQVKLKKLADLIGTNFSVEIIGHADSRGPEPLNFKLSERRAETVREALLKGGLTEKGIVAYGRGESEPLDPRNNSEAWAKNRRIELILTPTASATPEMASEVSRFVRGF